MKAFWMFRGCKTSIDQAFFLPDSTCMIDVPSTFPFFPSRNLEGFTASIKLILDGLIRGIRQSKMGRIFSVITIFFVKCLLLIT